MVRVVLIGIGGYGENYIKEFSEREIPDGTLVAVVDPFIERSQYLPFIERISVPVFKDLDDFLKSQVRGELAVVSSPIHTHYEYIKKLLSHGYDILTEKPVTIDIERMNELIRDERESGHFVAVGYQLCFQNDVTQMKKDILSGKYGKPIRAKALRMMRRDRKYYSRTGWAGRLKAGGEYVLDSPLSNACAHHAEAMLYLLGKSMDETLHVSSVSGSLYKGRPDIQNYDAAAIKIETQEGIPLYYYTAHSIEEKKIGPYLEIEFDGGKIVGDDDAFKGYLNDGRVIDYSRIDKGERLKKLYDSIECTKNKSRPLISLSTSIEHVNLVLKTEELPVYIVYNAELVGEGDDETYVIPGLSESFLSSYRQWEIPKCIMGDNSHKIEKENSKTRRSI